MQVWPAIDLRGGKCVRLRQGDYLRETVFSSNPLEVARQIADAGAEFLHIVDLDGARSGKPEHGSLVAEIVKTTNLTVELGGGIRDESTIQELLVCGLNRLVLGTTAVAQREWFREMCHKYPDRLVLGIDARDGLVSTQGWTETTRLTATELARGLQDVPVAALVFTDIARDGMMTGPNFVALRQICDATTTPVIASGGVSDLADIEGLKHTGVVGCIIGRAWYEGQIDLSKAIQIAMEPIHPLHE